MGERQARFYKNNGPFTIKQLAERIAGLNPKIVGSEDSVIQGVSSLSQANEGDISLFNNIRYRKELKQTKAKVCITSQNYTHLALKDMTLLIVDNPALAFAEVIDIFYSEKNKELYSNENISPRANIDPSAKIGSGCYIEPGAYIGRDVVIGNDCVILANSYIGDGVIIGNNTFIGPNAILMYCIVGNRCIIYAGAAIGQNSLAFIPDKNGKIRKIQQYGIVVIEDEVEIGANALVERATSNETVIGAGTKIGGLVQIAHNVRIGRGCMIVGHGAIAGSTIIGNGVQMGGKVAVNGHITVGDGVMVAACSAIFRDVKPGAVIGGMPAVEAMQWRRQMAFLQQVGICREKHPKAQIEEENEL